MNPARKQVVKTLTRQFKSPHGLQPEFLPTDHLDPRDARLAVAIHRTTIQRLFTLEYLLNHHLKKPFEKLEPAMKAVLASAAAQLFFMRKLPTHAVVDEAVNIAKERLRKGAGNLANAVLRKLALLVGPESPTPWVPTANLLPFESGSLQLTSNILPPTDNLSTHLAIATSHPTALIQTWLDQYAPEQTTHLALHSLKSPPTLIAIPPDDTLNPSDDYTPHHSPNFILYKASHTSLGKHLAAHPDHRVQDPTSAAPVLTTASLQPKTIIDVCAGRGTKTRQLAALHPNAKVIATDTDPLRFEDLQSATAHLKNILPIPFDLLEQYTNRADLVLADVPCTNTGTLARRLEARYRYDDVSLQSLIALQRQITKHAHTLLNKNQPAHLLYSTCSIDQCENQTQTHWAVNTLKLHLIEEHLTLPEGDNTTYRDGGYFALLSTTPTN